MNKSHPYLIVDALQYNNWSESVFKQMNYGGVSAVHATICFHEDFQEMVKNVICWNRFFDKYSNLIFQGFSSDDILKAQEEGRTAIFFGFQNCSPIEDDIGLVEICYRLGVRLMQLSYNNQSLLATGCYENDDLGITRMGRQVIKEMNRLGIVIDMSHSASRSTLEAIQISDRPIAITHANPSFWYDAKRNKSNDLLISLGKSGGMLGFSMYPYHLKNKSECSLEEFCGMIAKTADLIGVGSIGIGSDLCQNQPDNIVEWMRNGTWSLEKDFGEGSKEMSGFPLQPNWFKSNLDFINIKGGLSKIGFNEKEVELIMGLNWFKFFEKSFGKEEK